VFEQFVKPFDDSVDFYLTSTSKVRMSIVKGNREGRDTRLMS